MRISIDVGGTFTDVIPVEESTGQFHYAKTLTTHYDLAEGVLNGLNDILQISGTSMNDLRYLIHGTTIGTNAIVEGKGAKVGLLTIEGFENVFEIRRARRRHYHRRKRVLRFKGGGFHESRVPPPKLLRKRLR